MRHVIHQNYTLEAVPSLNPYAKARMWFRAEGKPIKRYVCYPGYPALYLDMIQDDIAELWAQLTATPEAAED